MTKLLVRQFETPQPYKTIFEQMQHFTQNRQPGDADEIWLLEHQSVFTQGQAGKPEHILQTTNIPIVQSDRGGQVTYHGPGQLMMYVLVDLKRLSLSVRGLVSTLENLIIDYLKQHNIQAHTLCKAPGVYVNSQKICSLGLRIKRGYSYHGLSFNIHMDLSPFHYINPCGYQNLQMTQLHHYCPNVTLTQVQEALLAAWCDRFSYSNIAVLQEDAREYQTTG